MHHRCLQRARMEVCWQFCPRHYIYTTVYTTHTIDLSKMLWSILDQKYRKTLGIAVME